MNEIDRYARTQLLVQLEAKNNNKITCQDYITMVL